MKTKVDKDLLEKEYIIKRKSVPQISKETGYTWSVLYRLLDKYKIKKRVGKEGPDYTNKKFGHWVVKKKHPLRRATWMCQCSCGVEKPVKSSNLLSGSSVLTVLEKDVERYLARFGVILKMEPHRDSYNLKYQLSMRGIFI